MQTPSRRVRHLVCVNARLAGDLAPPAETAVLFIAIGVTLCRGDAESEVIVYRSELVPWNRSPEWAPIDWWESRLPLAALGSYEAKVRLYQAENAWNAAGTAQFASVWVDEEVEGDEERREMEGGDAEGRGMDRPGPRVEEKQSSARKRGPEGAAASLQPDGQIGRVQRGSVCSASCILPADSVLLEEWVVEVESTWQKDSQIAPPRPSCLAASALSLTMHPLRCVWLSSAPAKRESCGNGGAATPASTSSREEQGCRSGESGAERSSSPVASSGAERSSSPVASSGAEQCAPTVASSGAPGKPVHGTAPDVASSGAISGELDRESLESILVALDVGLGSSLPLPSPRPKPVQSAEKPPDDPAPPRQTLAGLLFSKLLPAAASAAAPAPERPSPSRPRTRLSLATFATQTRLVAGACEALERLRASEQRLARRGSDAARLERARAAQAAALEAVAVERARLARLTAHCLRRASEARAQEMRLREALRARAQALLGGAQALALAGRRLGAAEEALQGPGGRGRVATELARLTARRCGLVAALGRALRVGPITVAVPQSPPGGYLEERLEAGWAGTAARLRSRHRVAGWEGEAGGEGRAVEGRERAREEEGKMPKAPARTAAPTSAATMASAHAPPPQPAERAVVRREARLGVGGLELDAGVWRRGFVAGDLDPDLREDRAAGAALSWLALCVQRSARVLGVPLRYPLLLCGSTSWVADVDWPVGCWSPAAALGGGAGLGPPGMQLLTLNPLPAMPPPLWPNAPALEALLGLHRGIPAPSPASHLLARAGAGPGGAPVPAAAAEAQRAQWFGPSPLSHPALQESASERALPPCLRRGRLWERGGGEAPGKSLPPNCVPRRRLYPLFAEAEPDRRRLAVGVHLLNADAAQLLAVHGLSAQGASRIVENVHALLLAASSAQTAVGRGY